MWISSVRASLPRASMLLATALAITQAGCGDRSRTGSPQIDAAAIWTAAGEPDLVLGRDGGPADRELGIIAGAVQLPDGTIAVADQQAHSIRFFAPDGRLTATAGGNGDGPGEFSYLWWMRAGDGDTVVTYDLNQRRLSWFTPQGFIRATAFVKAHGTHPEIHGPFRNGYLLQVENPRKAALPVTAQEPGPFNDTVALVLYNLGGSARSAFARIEDSDMVLSITKYRGIPSRTIATPYFGRTRYIASNTSGFAVGKNDSLKIDIYAPNGTVRHTIRMPVTLRPVTQADVDSFEQQMLVDETAPALAGFAEARASTPPPATMPAFADLIYDADRNLWVGEYTLPGSVPARFMVFDTTGTLIARATVPAMHRILSIGPTAVLGLVRDENDVQMVARFPLRKTPAARN
jgi:hypothetical protein